MTAAANAAPSALVVLRSQYRIASSLLLGVHLPALTDDLCLWSPGPGALTVRETDGRWVADWPDPEPDPAPPASIGWLTWHLIWWWREVAAAVDGLTIPGRSEIHWPGSAAATRDVIGQLHSRWRERLDSMSDKDAGRPVAFPWSERRPAVHTVAWVNQELMKNTAEIGVVRHLFAAVGGSEIVGR